MPDTQAVIKANRLNFIKRILTVESNCNKTESYILKTDDIGNFLQYKNNTRFLHPKFYEQLLDMWYAIHNNQPTQLKYVLQEHIWFDEHILVGNKTTYHKTWYHTICVRETPFCRKKSLNKSITYHVTFYITMD